MLKILYLCDNIFKNLKGRLMDENKKIIIVSVLSNGSLTLLKLIAGIFTGSISILSEALHSFGDFVASFIAFFSVVESSKPADVKHQFGHGKYEDMAGFIEAILIIISALFILWAGFEKIISNNQDMEIKAELAILIMILSVIINFIVGTILLKKGKEADSSAILGDGHHLLADVYSSLAVIVGLIAVKLTGLTILDPVIAISVAIMILKTGITLMGQTADSLLDSSLPKDDLNKIEEILEGYKAHGIKGVKAIKTSKSGSIKNIVLVIDFPCMMTLKDTHTLCDKIEFDLEHKLKNTNVVIHPEPDNVCDNKETCKWLKSCN